MKRLISTVGVLLFFGVAIPALALDDTRGDQAAPRATRRPIIVDDVIRMSQAGVGDDAIIAYVHKYRDRFDVNADDLIALADAHVSKDVVKVVVDEAAARKGNWDDRRTERPRYYGGAYFDPWFYPSYYPYSYWYGPRFGFGINIGPRFGHFHHRRR
jgi:hypothetical protein